MKFGECWKCKWIENGILRSVEGNNRGKLQIILFIADKIELGESDLKMMLKKHHEKRKRQPVRCQKVLGGETTFYL